MGEATSSAYTEQGMWDFRGADTKEFTHCFHIYPAMMIPQIARELIVRYGGEGGLLFDPYCGTGTSLVEARLAGMNSIGTDINPTARMIAESKILDYDLVILDQCIDSLLGDLERKNASEGPLYGTKLKYYGTEPEYVTWERLEDWFPKRSISEISYVIEIINRIQEKRASLFLRVALSECLRLVSFQRNSEFKLYRIPKDKRGEYYLPLLPLLRERILRNRNGLEQYLNSIDKITTVEICGFNTVKDDGNGYFPNTPSVDLVVTSPPYGDSGTTVAYAQFSWLSNVWLGLDDRAPGALDRELMGGRRTSIEKFGFKPMDEILDAIAIVDEKRSTEVMHFYKEYLQSIQNVASQIKNRGHVCYVVGNRTVKGEKLPTDQFTAWAFEQEGFEHLTTHIRDIPNKRMPSRNSPSNVSGETLPTMGHEYIVVCRKSDGGKKENKAKTRASNKPARDYRGPRFHKPLNDIDDLHEALQWLMELDWVPSAIKTNSPSGIGETSEEAIGLVATNKRLDIEFPRTKADLKSGRALAKTPKTEFTRVLQSTSDNFRGRSHSKRFEEIVMKYAYPSNRDNGRRNLYIVPNDSPHYPTGLYFEYDSVLERMWLSHIDDGKLCWYHQDDLNPGIAKMRLQFYIEAESKIIDGKEHFRFTTVTQMKYNGQLSPKSLFENVVDGKMCVNLRAHICNKVCIERNCTKWKKTGRLGVVRDHGTAIRTERDSIHEIFECVTLFSRKTHN